MLLRPSHSVNLSKIQNLPQKSLSYVNHGIITINKESDLSTFPGNGTLNNPYLISGYSFQDNSSSGSDNLQIFNIRDFVLIANCRFYVNGTENRNGITLVNTTNVIITNCIFEQSNIYAISAENNAISLTNWSQIDIMGNIIQDFIYSYGIWIIDNCSNINIQNNNLFNNYACISFNGITNSWAYNVTVIGNVINRCFYGIYLDEVTLGIIINNTIIKANETGTYIYDSSNTALTEGNNTIISYPVILSIAINQNPIVNQSVLFALNLTGGVAPFTFHWNFGEFLD